MESFARGLEDESARFTQDEVSCGDVPFFRAGAEADEEFHAIIYASTGNRRLEQLISNLREQMYRYRVEYLKDTENRDTLIREHDELWESLKKRDRKSAEEYMRRHIMRQMDSIKSSLH